MENDPARQKGPSRGFIAVVGVLLLIMAFVCYVQFWPTSDSLPTPDEWIVPASQPTTAPGATIRRTGILDWPYPRVEVRTKITTRLPEGLVPLPGIRGRVLLRTLHASSVDFDENQDIAVPLRPLRVSHYLLALCLDQKSDVALAVWDTEEAAIMLSGHMAEPQPGTPNLLQVAAGSAARVIAAQTGDGRLVLVFFSSASLPSTDAFMVDPIAGSTTRLKTPEAVSPGFPKPIDSVSGHALFHNGAVYFTEDWSDQITSYDIATGRLSDLGAGSGVAGVHNGRLYYFRCTPLRQSLPCEFVARDLTSGGETVLFRTEWIDRAAVLSPCGQFVCMATRIPGRRSFASQVRNSLSGAVADPPVPVTVWCTVDGRDAFFVISQGRPMSWDVSPSTPATQSHPSTTSSPAE